MLAFTVNQTLMVIVIQFQTNIGNDNYIGLTPHLFGFLMKLLFWGSLIDDQMTHDTMTKTDYTMTI